MEGYGPQLPTLPNIPQIQLMPQEPLQARGNQAQQGGGWMPGATTVGAIFKDGVILASEKRVTYGNFIMSKGGKKVFKVTDRIGVACAGLVEICRFSPKKCRRKLASSAWMLEDKLVCVPQQNFWLTYCSTARLTVVHTNHRWRLR